MPCGPERRSTRSASRAQAQHFECIDVRDNCVCLYWGSVTFGLTDSQVVPSGYADQGSVAFEAARNVPTRRVPLEVCSALARGGVTCLNEYGRGSAAQAAMFAFVNA